MKTKSMYLLFLLWVVRSFALSEVDIAGAIVDLANQPVEGAIVQLTNRNMTTTTDETGAFRFLLFDTPLQQNAVAQHSAIELRDNQLTLHAQSAAPLRIALHTLAGEQLFATQRDLQAGTHQLNIGDEVTGLASALYILSVSHGAHNFSAPTLLRNGKLSLNGAPQLRAAAPQRRSRGIVAADTLKVFVDDSLYFRMPLQSVVNLDLDLSIELLPAMHTSKVKEIPDYWQLDKSYGGFPNGGGVHCGPTTAANGLMWLAENGYPKLADRDSDRKYALYKIVDTLGDKRYMNLGSGGIGPKGFCYGVDRYIRDRGLSYKSMKYQGWRSIGSKYYTGKKTPSMEWIKRNFMQMGVVFLNYGWYNYDKASGNYKRNGGHWMTMVGYGWNGDSEEPNCLIVHDPWTGKTFNNYRRMKRLTKGQLTGSFSELPRKAAGYYAYWTGKKYGLLDGAVVLHME